MIKLIILFDSNDFINDFYWIKMITMMKLMHLFN